MKRGRPRHDDILTPREWEVLDLVRQDLTNDAIADRLSISPNTAKFHVSEILTKLGVATREEAASWQPSSRARAGLSLPFARWFGASAGIARAVAAVAIVAVGLATLTFALTRESGEPFGAGPLGKIAFVRGGEIWVRALPDGSAERMVRGAGHSMPQWSANGEWLMYFRDEADESSPGLNRELWIVRSDGTSARQIPGRHIWAAWMPGSADEIMYSNPQELLFEHADGSGRRELDVESKLPMKSSPRENLVANSGLVPSPDGQWFAVGIGRLGPNGASYSGVWLMRPDGSNAREIFDLGPDPADRAIVTGWSPDGRYILYVTLPQDAEGDTLNDGSPLHAVSIVDGTAISLGVVAAPFAQSYAAAGSTMAFTAGSVRETWTDKHIVAVDPSSAARPLTATAVAASAPAASPLGDKIAYVASPDYGIDGRERALLERRIWVMSLDGTDARHLTSGTGFRDDAPAWSNDGSHLLFARLGYEACGPDTFALWLLDVDSGDLKMVEDDIDFFRTMNDRLVVGVVPPCSIEGTWTTDYFGRLNLGPVMDWWRP